MKKKLALLLIVSSMTALAATTTLTVNAFLSKSVSLTATSKKTTANVLPDTTALTDMSSVILNAKGEVGSGIKISAPKTLEVSDGASTPNKMILNTTFVGGTTGSDTTKAFTTLVLDADGKATTDLVMKVPVLTAQAVGVYTGDITVDVAYN